MESIGGYASYITVVYGANSLIGCEILWNEDKLLWQLYENLEWIIYGDFNEISLLEERDSHGLFDQNGANAFNDAANGFIELNSIGGFFSWCTGYGLNNTRSKLDQAFASTSWSL